MAGFAAPLALAVGVTALYDAVRFGSPFETGYGISVLSRAALIRQRAQGVFSVRHVPDNIFLLVFRGFDLQTQFPYLVPDPNGHSLLLTSPGLLAAVSAGVRTRTTRILWAAAFLVAVPLLLYYGGGGSGPTATATRSTSCRSCWRSSRSARAGGSVPSRSC